LDVNGSANVASNLTLTNPACAISNAGSLQVGGTLKVSTGTMLLGGANVTGGFDVNGRFGLSNSTGIANINSSNTFIGIGTTTPAYPLDVNGSAHLAGDLQVNGVANIIGDSTFQGNLIVGTTGYWKALQVTNQTLNSVASLFVDGSKTFTLSNSGNNINIKENLYITENTTLTKTTGALSNAGNVNIDGVLKVGGSITGTLSSTSIVPAGCISGTVANATYATSAGSITGATYAPTANPTFTGTTTTSTLKVGSYSPANQTNATFYSSVTGHVYGFATYSTSIVNNSYANPLTVTHNLNTTNYFIFVTPQSQYLNATAQYSGPNAFLISTTNPSGSTFNSVVVHFHMIFF
jgi:cytoskeletal protein CcmA (bactofilin family)